MWAIGIRYLTGNCIATATSDRDSPEWPPHPLRVYMAMAAAFFETTGGANERAALEWFESLPPPVIYASRAELRDVVTAFVPVNDCKGAEAVGPRRPRQPRTFPTVILEREFVYYAWPDAPLDETHQAALAAVLDKTTRVGHSTSLTQLWIEAVFQPAALGDKYEVWQPVEDGGSAAPLRRFFPGTLRSLETAYNAEAIEAFAQLSEQLANAKGKQKTALKKEVEHRFRYGAPASQRPEFRVTCGYRRGDDASPQVAKSCFDAELLILSIHDGPVLGLETTLRFTSAMRGAVLSQFTSPAEVPEWVSGHASDGSPSQRCHLAIVPLPFVDANYADGHLLGLALAFPRDVGPADRARSLRTLLLDEQTGMDVPIRLTLGGLGAITLRHETRSAPPLALRADAWTRPSKAWATVTPIVLDRFPKADRDHDRLAWLDEVQETIAESCVRTGLPRPIEISINHNAYLRGVPRANPRGAGFPAFPHRNGNGTRFMVHALLVFDQLIEGPLALGAGRFLGYGLCKPFRLKERHHGKA